EAGRILPMVAILGAAVFTAAYLMPILRIAYFPDAERVGASGRVESRWPIVLPLVVTAALSLLFGWFAPLVDVQAALALRAAADVFGGMP
ncbi:MAG TPA: hypothetical protein PK788_10850, partial [Gemmatimonadaceae bacterium]|nr:hypothetical protein [Gemmatimonadaceae bacterium]